VTFTVLPKKVLLREYFLKGGARDDNLPPVLGACRILLSQEHITLSTISLLTPELQFKGGDFSVLANFGIFPILFIKDIFGGCCLNPYIFTGGNKNKTEGQDKYASGIFIARSLRSMQLPFRLYSETC